MKKGVVLLIIVGTLCYFGMRWYSRKYPEGLKSSRPIAMDQRVSIKGSPKPGVIHEKDIILKIPKEKNPPVKAAGQIRSPEGSKSDRPIAMDQRVSIKGSPKPGVIHEKDIILEIPKEKNPPVKAAGQMRSVEFGVQNGSAPSVQVSDSANRKPQTVPAKQESKPSASTTKLRTVELVKLYLKEGKKYEARNALSDAYFAETSEANRKQIKEKLDKLNEELVFSLNPSKDAVVYVVNPGDTLSKIAKRYNTSYELIMRINKKQNTRIKVKEQLKVLIGKVSLLADKSDFTLTVLMNGHYIKQYPVGTGMAGKTPVGTFEIKDKLKNPVWYSPDGVYEHGHPKNILGSCWLGFKDKLGLQGYGIHGTTQPETIGTESSMGCIRMLNEDVEELYAFVIPGTEVIIQE